MKVRLPLMNFRSSLFSLLGVTCALSFVSCDKAKELYETAQKKVKEMKKGESQDGEALVTEVVSVNETDGRAIIMNERRLVIVEFYLDT